MLIKVTTNLYTVYSSGQVSVSYLLTDQQQLTKLIVITLFQTPATTLLVVLLPHQLLHSVSWTYFIKLEWLRPQSLELFIFPSTFSFV